MRSWIQTNWLFLLCVLAPALVGFAVYDQLPEELPVHWNAAGEVDDTMAKPWAFLILPASLLFTNLLLWLVPIIDPKKNTEHFRKPLYIIQLGLNLLLMLLGLVIIGAGLGYDLAVDKIVIFSVLLLLLVLGNYMPKFRPNYFVGIRTPWTLESAENWRRTHQFAGPLWVGGSLMGLVLAFLLPSPIFFWVFLTIVLTMSFLPMGYSYWLFRQGVK